MAKPFRLQLSGMKEFVHNGKHYPVNLIRKKMLRVSMRAHEGTIEVHAPHGVPWSFIQQTIEKHIGKLLPLLEKEGSCSRSHIYFLGKRCLNDDSYLGTIFKTPLDDYLSTRFQAELKKKAITYFTARVRYYEEVMGIKKPYQIKVRRMKARFGSNAKRTHTLTFALMLIHYSAPIVDSVIVHELAHYFEINHSRSFYDLIRRYYPTYDLQHAKLKQGMYR